jgi:hypothetical protein
MRSWADAAETQRRFPALDSVMQFEEQIRRVKELLGGSARVGARSAEIAATEQRLGVVLPADVKQLVSAFNGSENSTPVDHGWVTFWPLRAWQGVAEEPAAVSGSQLPEAILFADHSIVSWWYALNLRPGVSTAAVFLVNGVGPDHLVADSVSGFLQAIIDDADALYAKVGSPPPAETQ